MFTEEVLSTFNELDYTIYNAVLRSGAKLAQMQVRDLADAAHVSTASVMRFCKKLGCKGYSEFKYLYREELKSVAVKPENDEIQGLRSFLEYAQGDAFMEQINTAFHYLQAATHVLFVGVGASGTLANFGARIFCNVGCFGLCIDDPFLPIPNMKAANPVVVAISFSGKTDQTLLLTRRFIENGSIVISITNNERNPLAKMSDVNLPYFVKDIPIGGPFNLGTQVPVLYILELLGRMIYKYKKEEA